MKKNWPTQEKDMIIAQLIIEQYANKTDSDSLGLFELVVDQKEKRMNFQLSIWVVILAKQFKELYGAEQGDLVTRQVISRCLTGVETIH
ncbi:MAG: hypothetical protein A3F46_07225 [Legionellales bacterium RIFCSPHIGHO2_12_FULL_42_9]|nr:MAG: hypothetical protein A3F46_07225 [Legionellales bacterium RIFCSPHIGHO2_12_FULL_42_9]